LNIIVYLLKSFNYTYTDQLQLILIKKINVQNCRTYHWSAYIQFIYWVHGTLGRGRRKVVTAFVVNEIRKTTDGTYTGFTFL